MNLEIRKNMLQAVNNFLMEMSLAGKVSRARMKLVKAVDEALIELQEDVKTIREEHGEDESKRKADIEELLKEVAVIDVTRHKRLINELYLFLDTYDVEMDGKDGWVHDEILDAIELAQENSNEKDDE